MEEIRREQRLKDLKEKAKKEQAKALERDRRRKMDLKNQKRRDQREKGFGSWKFEKMKSSKKFSDPYKDRIERGQWYKMVSPDKKNESKIEFIDFNPTLLAKSQLLVLGNLAYFRKYLIWKPL